LIELSIVRAFFRVSNFRGNVFFVKESLFCPSKLKLSTVSKDSPYPSYSGNVARTRRLYSFGYFEISKEAEFQLATLIQELLQYETSSKTLEKKLSRKPTTSELAFFLKIRPEILLERLRTCSQAKDFIISCNLGLVAAISRKYKYGGVSMSDLFQEGITGLTRAAYKFNPDRNVRFKSYATWWIHCSIRKFVVNSSTPVRLPIYVHNILYNVRKIQKSKNGDGSEVQLEEIAEEVGISSGTLLNYLETSKTVLSSDKLEAGINSRTHSYAQESPEKNVQAPEEHMKRVEFQKKVLQWLSFLPEDQKQVVSLRLGIQDGVPRTFEEISRILNLSVETSGTIYRNARASVYRRRGFQEVTDLIQEFGSSL